MVKTNLKKLRILAFVKFSLVIESGILAIKDRDPNPNLSRGVFIGLSMGRAWPVQSYPEYWVGLLGVVQSLP